MSNLAGKRILVTGGSGFIPSHVVRRLVGLGAEVIVTTKYNSIVDNVRIVDLWDRVRVIEADLRNYDSLMQVREIKPQIVIHMAAYNHVGDSFLHVNEAIDSNMKGTANLLNVYDGYEKFIYTSTSEVYGGQTDVPFVESMTPNPISPYSIGKYGGEQYARMSMEQMNKPISIIRPFNAFGPYQSIRAVIAELILKCLAGESISLTEGKQTREFNFVENLVDGFILACEKDSAIGQTVNLGCAHEISIRDLVTLIHVKTDSESELKIGALPTRPTEIWRMYADAGRAETVLGWKPAISFEQGLERTIAWYREFLDQFDAKNSGLAKLATFNLR
ncbi:MAG: UDP-glucose 4-epimerase [Alphaproteobacteria bacterium]|jgi:UDP-glucose 4-epimerase